MEGTRGSEACEGSGVLWWGDRDTDCSDKGCVGVEVAMRMGELSGRMMTMMNLTVWRVRLCRVRGLVMESWDGDGMGGCLCRSDQVVRRG